MPRICERLLLEPDLTLEKTISIARQIESAVADAKVIAEGESKQVAAIQKQEKTRMHKNKTRIKSKDDKRVRGQQQCYRCGSANHLANDKSCPAKDCKCRTCGKIGHFSKVCKTASKSVNEVCLPEVTVLCVNDCHIDDGAPVGTFTIATPTSPTQTCTIRMMVDTGSGASILPQHIFKEHFSSCVLSPPKMQLLTYSKENIPVCGYLRLNVTYYGKTVAGEFNIVKSGTPLIGRDLCRALDIEIKGGCLIEPATNCAMLQPSSTSLASTDSPVPIPTVAGFGCTKNFIHKVKIRPGVKPVQQKLRHLPLSVRAAVSDELKMLEENGIIEKIDSSEWVSPIVVTKRKNNTIRMCVDLREPNKAVVQDSHPLPLIEDILSELHGSVMFSSLDLKNAYYQVQLHEESRGLTAFITHEGLYQFCRVPYGLCSAPSAFQRMMTMILKGLDGVQCYLDDVIVHGASKVIHNANLKAVLHRISEAGLKLNADKCKFNLTTLSFLGYRLAADDLHPDDAHTTAITNAPPPNDAATLRSFLGLSAWYSKFVPAYATLVEPMRALLRKDCEFHWTTEAQESFDRVKQAIVDSPALSLFNPNHSTILSCDASDYGVGAVLTQLDDTGTERTIAFASRSLSDAERKYSIIEKEALSCVWAAEKWRTWLWGRKFLLRTDHQALTTLLTSKGNSRAGLRVARWSARLMEFDYDVQYRPGSLNSVADCLSRLPLANTEHDFAETIESVAMISFASSAISKEDFQSVCNSCPVFAKLRTYQQTRWPKHKKGC